MIVIGVNSSIADEKKEDATMTRVKNKLASSRYNSFVMTNIFPLRATNPKGKLIKKFARSSAKVK